MESKVKEQKQKPTMPAWLQARQLNTRLLTHGILPEGIDSERLIEILDEENDYEGPYSPDLMMMLDSVDRACVQYLNCDPVFYREIFEPWYFDTLAPHIFNRKLPFDPPRISAPRDNGNIFLIVALIVIVAAIACLIASVFHPRLGAFARRTFHSSYSMTERSR